MSNLSDLVGEYFENNNFVNWKHEKLVEYLLDNGVTETSEDVIIKCIDTVLTSLLTSNNINKNMQNKAEKLKKTILSSFKKRPEIKKLIMQINMPTYNKAMAAEFPEYFNVLSDLQENDNESISQLSRRLIRASKWNIIDSKLANRIDNFNRKSQKKPVIWLNCLVTCLKTSTFANSDQAIFILKKLVSDDVVGNMNSYLFYFNNWIFKNENYYAIDAPTILSAITSVIQYKATPCRDIGSNPSENHVKCQMWSKILSDSFSEFNPVWELNHLFSGNAKKKFGKSDFAAVFITEFKTHYAFFVAEFEVDGFERHKDDIVVLAEGAFELNKIIASMGRFFSDDILSIRLHIALINDTCISFGSIRPELNTEKTRLYYVYDRDQHSFELNSGNKSKDIESVIFLVSYLRQVICEDGHRIQNLLKESKANSDGGRLYSISVLPNLPKVAERSIQLNTTYTPKNKRVRLMQN